MMSIFSRHLKAKSLLRYQSTVSLVNTPIVTIPIAQPKQRVLRIALVGRPNCGKSTLFNRLTNSKLAIVSSVPGTTRDRIMGSGHLIGLPLEVIDTGGLDDRGNVHENVQKQVDSAIQSADLILFLVDAREGITSLDLYFANWIRRRLNPKKQSTVTAINSTLSNTSAQSQSSTTTNKALKKEMILVANKSEGAHLSDSVLNTVSDSLTLGLGDPLLISASHGDGMADLAQALIGIAKAKGFCEEVLPTARRSSSGRSISSSISSSIATARSRTSVVGSTSSAAIDTDSTTTTITTDEKGIPTTAITTTTDIDTDNDTITTTATTTTVEEKRSKITTEERVIQLAVMGKPNVGKSSFINAVLGEERLIVGPVPGLTRDAVHIEWAYKNRKFRLVDTAGLTKIRTNTSLLKSDAELKRQKIIQATGRFDKSLPGVHEMSPEDDPSQFSQQVSEFALQSAMNALRFAQVVILMVEGKQGKFSKLDLQIVGKCLAEGRSIVIVANKSDIMETTGITPSAYEEGVRKHCEVMMREMGEVKVIACSATENKGISRALDAVIRTHDAWSKRHSTWVLNKWLKDLMVTQPVPTIAGRKLNMKYITQIKARPPTFGIFCNASEIPPAFQRFLRSKLQHDFDLQGVPIRFIIRKTKACLSKNDKNNANNGNGNNNTTTTRGNTMTNGRNEVIVPKKKEKTSRPLDRKKRKNFLVIKNLRSKRLENRKVNKRKQKGRWK